jgi:hypothetical protein
MPLLLKRTAGLDAAFATCDVLTVPQISATIALHIALLYAPHLPPPYAHIFASSYVVVVSS